MSLKTHIIFHHYEDFFTWTRKNFHYTNREFEEAIHYSLKGLMIETTLKLSERWALQNKRSFH